MSEGYTVIEAAKLLGIGSQAVYKLIWAGELESEGGHITRDAIVRLYRRRIECLEVRIKEIETFIGNLPVAP